jgi:hypothetical protein
LESIDAVICEGAYGCDADVEAKLLVVDVIGFKVEDDDVEDVEHVDDVDVAIIDRDICAGK